MVAQALNEQNQPCSKTFESITLAVAGYSSYQGRVLAEKFGLLVKPNLVVVFFGWNDHWLAYNTKDSAKVIRLSRNPWIGVRNGLYRFSRLVQANSWLWDTVFKSKVTEPINEVRVPLDEYRANLDRIYQIFQRKQIPVIFITAPTAHYKLGVPEPLIEGKLVQSRQAAFTLHRQYNQAVRDMTKSPNAVVLDLESEFNTFSHADLSKIFIHDGIHFTPVGLTLVARRLVETIETNFLTF